MLGARTTGRKTLLTRCASHDVNSQVRSDLNNDARRKVNTLIITDVHARDIIDKFVRDSIMDAREFAWESQLRFYWDKALVSSQLHAPLHMTGNNLLRPHLTDPRSDLQLIVYPVFAVLLPTG